MNETERYAEARAAVAEARSVVAFTGAGISAESGVPTYRSAGGLWRNYQAEGIWQQWALSSGIRRRCGGGTASAGA